METIDFESLVNKHSLKPGNLLYNSNALNGEAGEVANQVKKREMSIDKPEWVFQDIDPLHTTEVFENNTILELSDTLFYLTRCAADLGASLPYLMSLQKTKLESQSQHWQRTFLK